MRTDALRNGPRVGPWAMLLPLALLLAAPRLFAQAPAAPRETGPLLPAAPGATLTLNFPNGIALGEFIVAAETYTKKRFIFQNAQVKAAQIFIYAQTPFPTDQFFAVFETILAMNKYTLTPVPDPSGAGEPLAYKIVLVAEAASMYADVYSGEDMVKLPFDERWVSGIFKLEYINPTDIVPTLTNFVSNPKGIIALPTAGMLLVNDLGLNVKRIERILKLMDVKAPDIEMKVVKLKWAIATTLEPQLSRIVQTIMRTRIRPPKPGTQPGQETLEIVADPRTNSLIVVSEQHRIKEVLKMIDELDSGETPAQTRGVHIYRLRNTNSTVIAEILNRVYQGMHGYGYGMQGSYGYGTGYSYGYNPSYPGMTGAFPQATGQPYYGSRGFYGGGMYPGLGAGMGENPPTIVADERNNALVISADYYVYQNLVKIVQKLDVRRPQVLLEVAFVEVSSTNGLDLGVELATIGRPGEKARGFGATSFGLSRFVDTNGDSIPDARVPIPNTGVLAGIYKGQAGNIPALLYALESEGKLNVLQIPTAVTSDNEIASLIVESEKPTATYTRTDTGSDYRTFNGYEKAGLTVKITPHISEESILRLETEVEVSDFGEQPADPVLPPPKTSRKLKMSVTVPNGHTIVLGGLVRSMERESVSGIPLLKDIPLLGEAFKHTVTSRERGTLYMFITPYVFSDEGFHDYKRASKSRLSDIEALSGRRVGVTTPEEGIPQYMPPLKMLDPARPPD